jgi:hypothetical protein
MVALPLVAGADEIFLRSGGRLSGVIVERRADSIVVDVGPGRVTLPSRLVERISDGKPAFEVFRERAERLDAADVKGWLELGLWARDRDLLTQARQAFEHVVSMEPANPIAHRELGDVQVDGRWMNHEEGLRARGYVKFEGVWVTPDERAAMLEERAAAAQARQAEIEASARAREAEARARVAEAEARQAEAAASATEGIPLGLAYGGGVPYGGYGGVVIGGYGYGYGDGFRRHGGGRGRQNGPSCAPTRPVGTPPPAAPVSPGAIGGPPPSMIVGPPASKGPFSGVGPATKTGSRQAY